MSTNLALRERRNPADGDAYAQLNAPNDPEGLRIVASMVHEPEDDGKYDTTEVASGTRQTAQDAVCVGVDVRYQREVGTIAGFQEDAHERDEADHGALVVGVQAPNDNEHNTSDNTTDDDPGLLQPQ